MQRQQTPRSKTAIAASALVNRHTYLFTRQLAKASM
jgi:hypothetical protein